MYLGVEFLEEIFKQQRQKLSGQFEPLVAVVIAVVSVFTAVSVYRTSEHHRYVGRLHLEVPVEHLRRMKTRGGVICLGERVWFYSMTEDCQRIQR